MTKKTENKQSQAEDLNAFADKSAEINGKLGAWMQDIAHTEAKDLSDKMSETMKFWSGFSQDMMSVKNPSELMALNNRAGEELRSSLMNEFENNNKKVQKRTQELMELFG